MIAGESCFGRAEHPGEVAVSVRRGRSEQERRRHEDQFRILACGNSIDEHSDLTTAFHLQDFCADLVRVAVLVTGRIQPRERSRLCDDHVFDRHPGVVEDSIDLCARVGIDHLEAGVASGGCVEAFDQTVSSFLQFYDLFG